MQDVIVQLILNNEGENKYLTFVGKNSKTVFKLEGGIDQEHGRKFQIRGIPLHEALPQNVEGVRGSQVTLAASQQVVFRSVWFSNTFRQITFGLVRFWTMGIPADAIEPWGSKLVLDVDGVMPLNLT